MDAYEDVDKDYAAKRNALIPEAEAFANKKCRATFPGGNVRAHEAWTARWNLAFHSHMSYLSNALRVICPTCGGKGTL